MTMNSSSNQTIFPYNRSNRNFELNQEDKYLEMYEEFIYTKVILVICLFGLTANLLNIIILSKQSMTQTMSRMERSAHSGLIAFKVSDLLFCVTGLPHSFC